MSRLPTNRATTENVLRNDLGPYAENRFALAPKVWQLQQKLYLKAQREPRFRFYALYDRIYRTDVLWSAWSRVAANDGAPGVDGVRIADLVEDETSLTSLIEELGADLRARTYKPAPVRRSYIEKANGKLRPLGIPTVRDRIAQTAAKLILEPIFEADFQSCSHGFRPGRKAHDAIDEIKESVKSGRTTVLDADLSSYFDTIPHDHLMACVKKRVSDGSVLRLIGLWLACEIIEKDGDPPTRPRQGTPQGGVISPLLANIYLNWLDKLFFKADGPGDWANARLVRYADDFVICARYVGTRITKWLNDLMSRMGLTLNQEKTTVVNLDQNHTAVDFLGFSLRLAPSKFNDRKFCVVTPSPASVIRGMRQLSDLTDHRHAFKRSTVVVKEMNDFLHGWAGYFDYGYARTALRKIDWHARNSLTRHMKRRSQRPYRPPKGVSWYRHLTESMNLTRLAGRKRGASSEFRGKAGCGKSARPV